MIKAEGADRARMVESEERLRCMFLGIRLQEAVNTLETAAEAAKLATGPEERDPARALIEAQYSELDELMTESESCGNEVNGYLAGEFHGITQAMESGDAGRVSEAVREFSRQLSEASEGPW